MILATEIGKVRLLLYSKYVGVFLSTRPFYMVFLNRKSGEECLLNWKSQYSSPLSNLMVLIVLWNWFSTRMTKLWRSCLVSDFAFIKNTQVCLEKSSTTMRKYLWPCIEGIWNAPQISTWINWKISIVTQVLKRKKASYLA